MTISSTNRKIGPFFGGGPTTDFPFFFKVFKAADVLVVFTPLNGVDGEMLLDSQYEVDINADQNANPGGVVTLFAPLPAGSRLTLSSKLPFLQPTDLTNQGGFYPTVINAALDRLTIFVQQLAERLSRTLRFPISDIAPIIDLPNAGVRANKILGFDQYGNPIVISLSGLVAGAAYLDRVNVFTKNQSVVSVSAIKEGDTWYIDASRSNNFRIDLDSSGNLANPTNLTDGMVLNFRIRQDAVGGHVLTFGDIFTFPAEGMEASIAALSVDIVSAYYDGSTGKLYCCRTAGFDGALYGA